MTPNKTPNQTNTNHQAANVYNLRTKPDLAKYLHLACWSPSPSTWKAAVKKGFFATFPGLTPSLISKHLPPSIETAKGHRKKVNKNLRSTKLNSITENHHIMTALDYPTGTNARTNLVTFKTVIDYEPSGTVATDQTGRFPVRSSRGNQYLMVAYVRDANAILAVPIKNRNESSLVEAYNQIYDKLSFAGLKPIVQICDNECPRALKNFLKQKSITLQLVPPYDHRTNPAEKAIGTFKSHFLSGLASLPPTFPLHLWDRLVDHATTTLNLLRPSKLNPKLSAYAQLFGTFDYNKTPLAPPGCRALAYDSPSHRATWNSKGTETWYVGPAMDHYRCHRLYVPSTRAERVANTVDFFPHNCAVPFASPLDNATRAAESLASALKGHQPTSPFAAPGDAQYQAIQQLSNIFSQLTQQRKKTTPTNPRKSTMHPMQAPRVHTPPPPRVIPNKAITPIPPLTYNVPTPKQNQPTNVLNYISDDEDDSDDDDDGTILSPPDDIPDPHLTPRYNLRSRYAVACAVLNLETGDMEEYPALIRGKDKDTWFNAYGNDICRLAQGMPGRPDGTDTIHFIRRDQVPKHKKVTYGKKECTIRPNKAEVYRVRLTVGGDKLPYSGITSTKCASLTTAKLLLNSTISTPGARFGCIDIKNMYYGTPMDEYEYMKVKLSEIPSDVIKYYKLDNLAHTDGYVYMEIRKGMPGLKQAGRIANDRLVKHLDKYGYRPCHVTPALWKHESNGVTFALVVDDFGVKYVGQENFDHLVNALKDLYTITVDPDGKSFLGLTLTWDYTNGRVNISMPGYIKKVLTRFQHISRTRAQHSPHEWRIPKYGQKTQYAEDDDSPPAPITIKKHIQQVVGSLLYYALALDLTMLVALGSIAAQQNNPTAKTLSEVTWLLDYCATHPDATIQYNKSDMVLWTASDASYLSESKARSRAGGIFFLSNNTQDPTQPPKTPPTMNGVVYALAKIIPNVMSSAMEAEVAATYLTAKEAVPIRIALEEIGHPQPPTPMQVDNSTAVGFVNETIKYKRSKAIDMRFHWVRDRVHQNQFLIYWVPGHDNPLADYVTKHHPASHHTWMRPKFFITEHLANVVISQLLQQGCDISPKPRAARAQGLNKTPVNCDRYNNLDSYEFTNGTWD